MRPGGLFAAAIVVVIVTVTTAEPAPTLASCEQEIAAAPADFNAYRCFDRLSRVPGGRDEARDRLEQLVAAEPDNAHALTMLARLLDPRQPRPLALFDEALELYGNTGDRVGLGWAQLYRSRVQMIRLRLDEADGDAEIAASVALELDDYPLLAMCRFQQSRIAALRGDEGTLFGVLRTLVLDPRFDTLAPNFRAGVLQNLGSICGELNLRQTGMDYLERSAALALEHGLDDWLFDARHSMSSIAMARFHDGEIERDEALEMARSALEVAGGGWRRLIGELRVAELTPGDEGIRLLQEMADGEAAGSFGDFEVQTALGLRLLGDPERIVESIEPLERALESTRQGGFARNLVRGLSNLGRARLEVESREEAIESALRALDAVERLHGLQTGETIGAMNFSIYSPIYYATIGKLLAGDGVPPTPEDLELAFRVSERLRSRFLVEHLDRAGAARGGDLSESATKRRELLKRISEIQTQLLLSEATAAERVGIESELERLEEEEAMLRATIDRASPARRTGDVASIESVQHELRGDEALLSFLLSSPDSGGSWLLVVTSTNAQALALPARRKLDAAVRFWLGLLQRGDGSEGEPAARLYAEVMAGAVEVLPAGIRRLTIVPDGSLHRIPFDALRADRDGPPLLESFEISHVPSAGIWLRLRGLPDAGESGALILADPELTAATLDDDALRAFRFADVSIGRLPHARDEARGAVHSLGGGDLRIGAQASEAFVKQADLSGYRVLHFAAHALIDEEHPDRSAILLAPGNESEDGLLQAREVLDLDLPGAMVTLSACQSAGGRVLAGEGVMGLARSFFQARASVVVGGLWPLRDEVTARLMASFYRGLGRGLPAGEAMARAKREMHRAGLPPAAWAGVVVLGDGARAPWPAGSRSLSIPAPVGIAGLALIGVLFVLLILHRLLR